MTLSTYLSPTRINQALVVALLTALAIFLGNGLNYVGWVYLVQIRYYILLAAIVLPVAGLCFIQLRQRNVTFKYYILFISLWSTTVLFTSALNDGDVSAAVILALPYILVPPFFYIYRRIQLPESTAIGVILCVGFITFFIQTLQQFFPFVALFGDLGTGDGTEIFVNTEIRNGIYRFFVGNYQVQLLCLMFCWCKVLEKPRTGYILLTLCFLFSIYVYVTKQVLIAAAIALAISPFFTKDRHIKIAALMLFVVLIMMGAIFWDTLFAGLIKDSQDDGFSHSIRFEFMAYITDYFLNHPFPFLVGKGFDTPLEREWIRMYYHISDIGFVGIIFYFGCLWPIAYFYVIYKLLVKHQKKAPLYIKLYLVASLIMSPFIFPYRDRLECFNWMTVLYIASIYIDKPTSYAVFRHDTSIQESLSEGSN